VYLRSGLHHAEEVKATYGSEFMMVTHDHQRDSPLPRTITDSLSVDISVEFSGTTSFEACYWLP
jgi:hypothetical protein